MSALMGELQMIRGSLVSEHDAVEAVMIVKLIQHFKAESISVKLHDLGQVVRGPCHSQMGSSQTCHSVVHRFLLTRESRLCTVVRGCHRSAITRPIAWQELILQL